jgi:copper chaperone CopZ
MNKRIMALSALGSAGLASICCIGPLVLAGLGVGGLGFAALSRYRPLFLALTGIILIIAFYFAYRKRSVSCADGSCKQRSGSPGVKAVLWVVAVLAVALAFFPYWPSLHSAGSRASAPAAAQTLLFKVSGMTCAACTVAIKKSVEKVPGVSSADIDFDRQLLKITTSPKTDPKAVLNAVASAGYKAELLTGGNNVTPR